MAILLGLFYYNRDFYDFYWFYWLCGCIFVFAELVEFGLAF